MADVISMIAGIGSILKAFGSTGVYLRSVSNASKEAQLIADQLHATEAILKALKTSLKVSPPSSSSYATWADSMNLVLGKVRSIIDDLNTKLSSQRGVVRLSFRKKVMWPFDKEDSAALLENLKAYWHMISIAQTSLTSGNAQTVQKSAREIDDMLTQVGNRHPSTIVRTNAKMITPWDSVSQISVQSSETKSSLIEKAVGIWCQRGNARCVQQPICSLVTFADNRKLSERSGEQKRLQKAKPPFPISESSWTPPVYLNTYEASM
ncbi:hypothetical protein AG0111_0g10452 [Alternaria gaisen]|uniref:Uncharacterized protein n=1 Tax=Alternaria gaisen TaxID=167740 RepID=A0ACB6FB73_9PLEO|nr:hypothetical protein AG0111_0g10452 [Alternaria gaisen]